MWKGRPVVASAVGGLPEAVVAGRTGLLVPAEDPAALGAAIVELAADLERARRMGGEGRERVIAEFSMEHMTEAYERLYAKVAADVAVEVGRTR